MWTNKMTQTFADHQKIFGARHRDRIINQLIEEMAELTQCLCKRQRLAMGDMTVNAGDNTANLVEEIADVTICLEFLIRDMGLGCKITIADYDQNSKPLVAKIEEKCFTLQQRMGTE